MRTIRIPSFKRYLIASHFAYEFDLKSRRIALRGINQIYSSSHVYTRRKIRSLKFVTFHEKRGFEKNDEIIAYTIEKFLKKIDEEIRFIRICFYSILLIEQNSRYKRRYKVSRILFAIFTKWIPLQISYLFSLSLKSHHPPWKRGHLIRRIIKEESRINSHPFPLRSSFHSFRPLFLIERDTVIHTRFYRAPV